MPRQMTHGVLLYRNRLAFSAAVIAPFIVAAVLVPFRGTFANTAAALTMVIVITAIAVIGLRLAGIVASASAALWFDFFLTRPYDRFVVIGHRPDLETIDANLRRRGARDRTGGPQPTSLARGEQRDCVRRDDS